MTDPERIALLRRHVKEQDQYLPIWWRLIFGALAALREVETMEKI